MMAIQEMTTVQPEETTPTARPAGIPAWAERLAQRVHHAHQPASERPARPDQRLRDATTPLWAQFDEAVSAANEALGQVGVSERIAVRHSADEYVLSAPDALGGERSITIFTQVRAIKGRVSGGAQITTSETRATIYLTVSVENNHLRWMLPRARTEFSARIVDDLLLSVFADDPAATRRLSPFFSTGDE